MSTKRNIEDLRLSFQERGWTLLSTDYIDNKSPLEALCPNNHKTSIAWNNFQKGSGCKICHHNFAFSLEEVKEYFISQGCKLLTKNYENNYQLMDYICSCGTSSKIRFRDFKRGGRCNACKGSRLKKEQLNSSIFKDEILLFIKENSPYKVIDTDDVANIVIPEINLSVNFYSFQDYESIGKNFLVQKCDYAKKIDLHLIQTNEYEWLNKKQIVQSRLLNFLNKNEKIYARKTKIAILTKNEKSSFLTQTHIQGNDNTSICLGLIYQNQIVACMTFGKPRYNKNCDYELIRYSSKLGINVVGGASKLLSYFLKEYNGNIISYADRRWSNGNLYYQLGFTLNGITEPGYSYYNPNNKKMYNRVAFQKHKLKDMPNYVDDLTEEQIMKLNGYKKIYNAGQFRFILENKK